MIYRPLNLDDKYFHLFGMFNDNFLPISGIFASGEANYYDLQQNPRYMVHVGYNYTIVIPMGQFPLNDFTKDLSGYLPAPYPYEEEILAPSGFYFPLHVSNAIDSLLFSINDFSIFEPYVHYTPRLGGQSSGFTNENPDLFGGSDEESNIQSSGDGLAFLINTSFIANLAIFEYNILASGNFNINNP